MDYPNPKMKFIDKVFGPVMDSFEKFGLSGAFFPVILFIPIYYFKFFYRRPKNKKLGFYEWAWLVIWIFATILAVLMHLEQVKRGHLPINN